MVSEEPKKPALHSSTSTPLMNAIEEEDDIPPTPTMRSTGEFKTPYLNAGENLSSTDLFTTAKATIQDSQTKPQASFMSPPAPGFYSAKDGNNSSSSLIYNPTFTFGGSATGPATAGVTASPKPPSVQVQSGNTTPKLKASMREPRRNSLKYIPGSKLGPPPTSRNRSPIRTASPEMIPSTKRNSALLESPFNFTQAHIASPHKSTPPPSGGTASSRASFRKGHRYKHSSVSMNFFQEPEVKIPLNIAKSLPIPEYNDIFENLPWPKAYVQLSILSFQIILGIGTFLIGNFKSWTNFITLSHFITYDIIGSATIILIETLSQFESWATGTITFPFGLNRIDVLSSFALAVSLCFVALDLLFHILEESIAVFVESSKQGHHDDIAPQIPHSHNDGAVAAQLKTGNNMLLWYAILLTSLVLANLSLFKTFYANTNSKLKTKNPIITIIYTCYLFVFPHLPEELSTIVDYAATFFTAMFILIHGMTIAEWTSTILLMGFSTTVLPSSTFLLDQSSGEQELEDINSHNEKMKLGGGLNDVIRGRQRSMSSLPVATSLKSQGRGLNVFGALLDFLKGGKFRINSGFNTPTNIKSLIKEQIENLPEFKARCNLHYNDLVIMKVNFSLFVVLLKIDLKGGSNDDELTLRLAVDRCIKRCLPNCETTIEIDRI